MMKPGAILKRSLVLFRETLGRWQADQAPRMAAALAYYTTFSIGPILIISIAVAGLVFPPDEARRELLGQIGGLVGSEGARAIATIVDHAAHQKGSSLVAALLGAAALLFGATGVFGELQSSLNTVWKVERKKGRRTLGFLKDRFLSFGMVFGTAFLLLVSLVTSAALAAFGTWLGRWTGGVAVLRALYALLSFGIIALLFSLMFKVVPDAKTRWKEVWLGGVLTAVFFTLGKFLIGLYLGKSGLSTRYGAAGSLVIFLAWIYYSAQIFLAGAEFTRTLAERHPGAVRPTEDARPVRVEKVAAAPGRK